MGNAVMKFVASRGAHTGSSGFTNYMGGCSPEDLNRTLQQVAKEFPKAVVIDGNDDWYAKPQYSPSIFPGKFGVKPLAFFHTGISGVSSSGIVISKSDYAKLRKAYKAEYGKYPRQTLRVYELDVSPFLFL